MTGIDWYFDFVSPFSHICLQRMRGLASEVNYRPVLFAALLERCGQKGPAEIPEKRKWTYRWCNWWARELDITFRFPAAHPFNPLPYLRLAIACGSRQEAVARIFEFIWTTGEDAADPARLRALCRLLDIEESALAAPEVKSALRRNTEEAAARGIFGVPSFVVDGEVFWGADSIEFMQAFMRNPAILRDAETRRLDRLPVAASRSG